jgi:hypothetical protein
LNLETTTFTLKEFGTLNFSISKKCIHNYIENMCIANILLRKKKTDLHDDDDEEEEEEEDSRDLLHA